MSRYTHRRYFSLVALIGIGLIASGASAAPTKNSDEPAKSCSERGFLGKRVEARSLTGVLEWTQSSGEGRWQAPGISTPLHTSAQVVLVHLWAHWCGPCKKDFAIYAALANRLPQQLYKRYGAEASRSPVQFLYLAEDTPNGAMREFLAGNADLLRGGGNFQDAGGQLMRDLQRQSGCSVSLPLTLLIDREQRVQAAFVGSIESRREELLDTMVRLAKPTGIQNVAKASTPAGAL